MDSSGGQNRRILALVCVGDNLGIVTLAFRRQAMVDRKPIVDAISTRRCCALCFFTTK